MLKNAFVSKRGDVQKLMMFLIHQLLFCFEMREYASFAEMNTILMTIAKTQLLSFDGRLTATVV